MYELFCFPCLLTGILLAAQGISADPPRALVCAGAADLLHAPSPRAKAWGAHWVAACGLTSLAGEIGTELEQLRPELAARFRWDSEPLWEAHAMLDALIQLRSPVQKPVLAAVGRGFPVEATILMLQDSAANPDLLAAVWGRPGSLERVAAGNALARIRAPGFAASVLAEVHFEHYIEVSETGEAGGRGVAGSLGSSSPTVRVPADFPPTAIYRLMAHKTESCELVSDGPIAVYSEKIVLQPGVERTLNWPAEGVWEQRLDIGYLAQMSRKTAAEVEHGVQPSTGLKWSNLLQLNADIGAAVSQQKAVIKELIDALVSAGALKRSELKRPLQIAVEINDGRRDRAILLPTSMSIEVPF